MRKAFPSFMRNALPPLVDFDILGMTRSLKFSDIKERDGF